MQELPSSGCKAQGIRPGSGSLSGLGARSETASNPGNSQSNFGEAEVWAKQSRRKGPSGFWSRIGFRRAKGSWEPWRKKRMGLHYDHWFCTCTDLHQARPGRDFRVRGWNLIEHCRRSYTADWIEPRLFDFLKIKTEIRKIKIDLCPPPNWINNFEITLLKTKMVYLKTILIVFFKDLNIKFLIVIDNFLVFFL